jgi:hypothetical protein
MRVTVMLLVSVMAGSAGAEIYKWVDEDGNVHYSQRQPPKESQPQTTEIVDLKTGGGSDDARKALDKDIQRADKLRTERLKHQADQQQAAAEQAERKRGCDSARARLQSLEESQRIFHIDEQGNRVRVGEEQRQADMAEAREQIAEYCK